jgi:arsenate reductase-like glutaredoxin family protein
LLLQSGAEIEERDFFKDVLTEAEIRELSEGSGIAQLFARRSPSLKKLGLADQELSEEQMVELMLREPRLIRRPLVRLGGRLLVGANLKAVEAALAETS